MADLPEYKRSNRIEPGNVVGGFQEALGNIGKATGDIGEWGLQVARNAAVEQATIEGVKAGQTPGRKLLPAFTESDQAFVKAYKQEEYNTVAREAENYLQKAYFDVAKNPTSEGLSLYQQNAQAQIEKLSSLVSEENRPKLKRDLMSAYESKFYQLAGTLENKNKENLKTNFNLNNEKADRDIQTYTAEGEFDKAKEQLNRSIEEIRSQIGSDAVPTKEWADVLIENKRKVYSISAEQADLAEAQKEGKGAEFLANRAQLPPTPDNLEINAALLKQQQSYNQMLSMNSHIARNEATEALIGGNLSESSRLNYESKMTELDRSAFQLEISKVNLKGIEQAQQIQYVKDNANNSVALSTVGGSVMDEVFESDVSNFTKLEGRQPSMKDMASMAASYDTPIPSFNKQLGAMINSRDPNVAIEGAGIYKSMSLRNPRAVDGVSKEDEGRASLISSAISAGENPVDAINTVNEKISSLRKADIEERKSKLKDIMSLQKLNKPTNLESFVADRMGYKKEIVPSGLYRDYNQNLENYYVITGDWDTANDLAKNAVDRVYKKTNINGDEQVMWLGLEGSVFNKNLLVRKCENIFKGQKSAFDNKESGASYYYKFPEGQIQPETNILTESRVSGSKEANILRGFRDENQPIPIIRVSSDGTEEKGTLYVSSDDITDLPSAGNNPSYGMFFLKEGKRVPYPIYSPEDIGNMERFTITSEDMKEANSIIAKRNEAEYNKILYWRNVDKLVKESRERLGEPENEPL